MNKAQTYFFTGQLLSLDWQPQNREMVAGNLKNGQINWKGWMQLGSDNLILPSVFLALKRHQLEELVPNGFGETLAEILELNRQRNINVLQLLDFVSGQLSSHSIDFIVMKGVGNMVDGLYSDPGERITYDLDVLVEPGKMVDAASILMSHDFMPRKKFNPTALASTMHYPILLREDFAAGVEIHCEPTQYLYSEKFTSQRVFASSITATKNKHFRVMGYRERIIHNFLHGQLMHHGHWHANVSLRDLYDLLLLSGKENLQDTFNNYNHFTSRSSAYLHLYYKVFGLETPEDLVNTKRGVFFMKRHQQVLSFSRKGLKRYLLMWLLFQKYILLPMRMLVNPRARNYVFSRLTDRCWYKSHFEAMVRAFSR